MMGRRKYLLPEEAIVILDNLKDFTSISLTGKEEEAFNIAVQALRDSLWTLYRIKRPGIGQEIYATGSDGMHRIMYTGRYMGEAADHPLVYSDARTIPSEKYGLIAWKPVPKPEPYRGKR